jgi:hypothetical protein
MLIQPGNVPNRADVGLLACVCPVSELVMWAVSGSMGVASRKGRRSRYEGIVLRHARGCRSRERARCSCSSGFQAQVWSAGERETIRKTFRTLAEARAWRHESQVALRKGTLHSSSPTTLREAAEEWLVAAEAGTVRTRTGKEFRRGSRWGTYEAVGCEAAAAVPARRPTRPRCGRAGSER